MRLKLCVAVPRVQDMPKPGVLKEDHTYAIRRLGLGEYGALFGAAQSVAEGIRRRRYFSGGLRPTESPHPRSDGAVPPPRLVPSAGRGGGVEAVGALPDVV